jgi:ABC-type transporter Mla subunit MlaD
MAIDPLNRKMSMVAAFFAFVGVVLGVVALATNYWTVENVFTPGKAVTMQNGTMFMNENSDWTWNVS